MSEFVAGVPWREALDGGHREQDQGRRLGVEERISTGLLESPVPRGVAGDDEITDNDHVPISRQDGHAEQRGPRDEGRSW